MLGYIISVCLFYTFLVKRRDSFRTVKDTTKKKQASLSLCLSTKVCDTNIAEKCLPMYRKCCYCCLFPHLILLLLLPMLMTMMMMLFSLCLSFRCFTRYFFVFSFSFVLKCILLSFNVMLLLIYFILLLFMSYISAVCVRFEAPFNSFTLPLILLSC